MFFIVMLWLGVAWAVYPTVLDTVRQQNAENIAAVATTARLS